MSGFFILRYIFNKGLAFGDVFCFVFWFFNLPATITAKDSWCLSQAAEISGKKQKQRSNKATPKFPTNFKVKISKEELHTSWVSITCAEQEFWKWSSLGEWIKVAHPNPPCPSCTTTGWWAQATSISRGSTRCALWALWFLCSVNTQPITEINLSSLSTGCGPPRPRQLLVVSKKSCCHEPKSK